MQLRTSVATPEAALVDDLGTHDVWSVPKGGMAAQSGRHPNADLILYVFSKARSRPDWVVGLSTTFPNALPVTAFGTALSAIAFVHETPEGDGEAPSWLAWCFGQGHWKLRRRALEPRFGLLVALNSIGADSERPSGLKDVQFRAYSPSFQSGSVKTSTPQNVDALRFDRLSDQLARAGGTSANALLAGKITGGRAVQLEYDILGAPTFRAVSQEVVAQARKLTYQTNYAWIDQCVPVDDEALEDVLGELVVNRLLAADSTALDLLVVDDGETPEPRDIRFVLFPGESAMNTSRTVATIPALGHWLCSRHLVSTAGELLQMPIRLLDEAHEVLARVSVLAVLSAQIGHDGKTFILYDGDFYCASSTYVEALNAQVDALEAGPNLAMLDSWNGCDEATFNKSVVVEFPDRYLLMDRRLIRFDGESPFEAADIISREGTFIHVKRKDRSSTFGHLLNQARVCGEALLGGAGRNGLSEKRGNALTWSWPGGRPFARRGMSSRMLIGRPAGRSPPANCAGSVRSAV